jgi:hypothetical protein
VPPTVGMLSYASYCLDAELCLLLLGCSVVPPTVGMLNCRSYFWDAQLCLLLLGRSVVNPTVGMLSCASYCWDAQLLILLLGCSVVPLAVPSPHIPCFGTTDVPAAVPVARPLDRALSCAARTDLLHGAHISPAIHCLAE